MWPQQPLSERVPYISKKWDFWWSIPVLAILVPVMIKSSGSGWFFWKLGFRGCWGQWGCRGWWGQWGCRSSRVWKITTEDSRVLQDREYNFILMFWKTISLVESWNIIFKFSTFSVGGCWGQLMLNFWKFFTSAFQNHIQNNSNQFQLAYFYLSEPIHRCYFNMRYPVSRVNTHSTYLHSTIDWKIDCFTVCQSDFK